MNAVNAGRPLATVAKLMLLALSFFGGHGAWGADAAASREYELKAAFLFNFTKFIDWPPESFIHRNAPIVMGVLGSDAFGSELERLVGQRKVNGRAIIVRRVHVPEEARATHLLFVGASSEVGFAHLQMQLGQSPVVTVGESAAFAASGGIINFLVEQNKLRFEINVAAAERAGVRISAQLQQLAVAVRR